MNRITINCEWHIDFLFEEAGSEQQRLYQPVLFWEYKFSPFGYILYQEGVELGLVYVLTYSMFYDSPLFKGRKWNNPGA